MGSLARSPLSGFPGSAAGPRSLGGGMRIALPAISSRGAAAGAYPRRVLTPAPHSRPRGREGSGRALGPRRSASRRYKRPLEPHAEPAPRRCPRVPTRLEHSATQAVPGLRGGARGPAAHHGRCPLGVRGGAGARGQDRL